MIIDALISLSLFFWFWRFATERELSRITACGASVLLYFLGQFLTFVGLTMVGVDSTTLMAATSIMVVCSTGANDSRAMSCRSTIDDVVGVRR